ncbi:hypothetical protein KQ51_01198 [Candidatus Izimaplasma bacterium HR1]|jgi:hypothetical protein|uniref:hypothetical protein n=1 Tax=Candidatus Izimoplasma sp. HR1 TaxID=1541959 RepID=UPI0004F5B4F0|nr:hypothetical protein KQ51_01198 [Candidatus Izimaplasma bacterium HR1]
MDVSKCAKEYKQRLDYLSKTPLFGKAAITHYLSRKELKVTGFRDFYNENNLMYARKLEPGEYVDVTKEEHPTICGGVTEYITKIKLARKLGKSLVELRFFDDVNKEKYSNLSDEELAFVMYEHDIVYRSGYGYTPEIFEHKNNIIKKASELAKIALELISKTFPIINEIDFHPDGHVLYKGDLAIKGDSDLLINNCLIDFKTKKDFKLSKKERAQLFAYALHKYMRDEENYDKVYFLNPRFNMLEELLLQ